jgi:hypothetical protein
LGIEKSLGKKYQSDFINAIEENNIYLENLYMDAPHGKDTINTYHYIDESEFIEKTTKKHYLILSLVSINGDFLKNSISDEITSLKNDLVIDLRNGLTNKQKEKLFHYVEDNIMVKEKYIPLLRTLSIEAYLMFKFEDSKMDKKSYQNSYYSIFNSLVSNILRRYKNNTNQIIVEENSKISLEELKRIVLYKDHFYPITIISKGTKDDILLSIPDYILGIIRDCMKNDFSKKLEKLKAGQNLIEDTKFHEISDKIRLIADLNRSQFFTRQNNNRVSCIELNQYIHKNLAQNISISKMAILKKTTHSFLSSLKKVFGL